MKLQSPRIPSATYRLQFNAEFTFHDAIGILDYLQELGISDVYASPFFQAGEESTHGYDVADHNRLSPMVGGKAGFKQLVDELQRRNMGLVLDFVPNHMGISESLNSWWMAVLEEGHASKFAHYFDIDWYPTKKAFSEKLLLPVLGNRYGAVLEAGELRLACENGAFFLYYYETKVPVSPLTYATILEPAKQLLTPPADAELAACIAAFATGEKSAAKAQLARAMESSPTIRTAIEQAIATLQGTPGDPSSFDALHDLLENQAYRLCYWRTAAEEINYRRFFDINTLAALCVEVPEVFEASHLLVFEFLQRGEVTGIRIDHVDGLWDPRAYLIRLQERYRELTGYDGDAPGLYLVVEKILEATSESLPSDWPVHGTTGYEFANHIVHLLTHSGSAKHLTKTYEAFTQSKETFADLVYKKKMLVIEFSFASELAALGRDLDELSEFHRHYRDFTLNQTTKAIREVAACFPVYRTYVSEGNAPNPIEERLILRAVSNARRRNPSIDKPVFDFLRDLLLMRFPEDLTPEQRERHLNFVMKFQQCTGPVMAKGLEDTALYLYHRLVALNEVGGNPGEFGISPAEFHRLTKERGDSFPNGMLATSTHDTKRSEDVRMRMVALSEIPGEWRKAAQRWRRMNRKFRTNFEGDSAPSANEEYLLYQTLIGAWPLDPLTPETRKSFIARIQEYMLKALKEGKVNSSWIDPNEDWEIAVASFIKRILDESDGAAFQEDFLKTLELVLAPGLWNSLSQTVLKCTAPGVPDIYQGTELWDLSLVDPDNRRPVDYAIRRQLLAETTDPSEMIADWRNGKIKLHVLKNLLRFRREHAAFFRSSDYQPVPVIGARANHAVAFLRSHGTEQLLVITCRLTAALGSRPLQETWSETTIALPSGSRGTWHNLLTAENTVIERDQPELSGLLVSFPFAVLHRSVKS